MREVIFSPEKVGKFFVRPVQMSKGLAIHFLERPAKSFGVLARIFDRLPELIGNRFRKRPIGHH